MRDVVADARSRSRRRTREIDRGDVRAGLGHHRGPGPDRGRAALLAGGREPRPRGAAGIRPSRSEAASDGGLTWRATVSGPIEIRLWILSWGDDVEVLEPAALRDDVAATHARAAARYAARSRSLMARHPFSAVNLISDPIHGYVELTKRLSRGRIGAPPGCPTRRPPRRTSSTPRGSSGCAGSASSRAPAGSSRPPSTRGSPTASGVMHEAGLWARHALPVAAGDAGRRRRRAGRRPRASSSRRSGSRACSTTSATGRSPTSSTSTSCAAFPAPPDAAPAGRQAADPRGPLAADHRAGARAS